MLKIGLYHNFCERLSVMDMNHNTYDYRKNQSYTTDRPATSAIGRGLSPRQKVMYRMAGSSVERMYISHLKEASGSIFSV